jgi:hypothetical protein
MTHCITKYMAIACVHDHNVFTVSSQDKEDDIAGLAIQLFC